MLKQRIITADFVTAGGRWGGFYLPAWMGMAVQRCWFAWAGWEWARWLG